MVAGGSAGGGAFGTDLLDLDEGGAELLDPVAFVVVDESDAPGEGLRSAAGDAGVDERVEHPALAHAEAGHDPDAQARGDLLHLPPAPRPVAPAAHPRP